MDLAGLLVIDKPEGPTSHDVVARVRRVLRRTRVGHTGTLDPLATGVLPLVLGRATRLARFLTSDDKRYGPTCGWAWRRTPTIATASRWRRRRRCPATSTRACASARSTRWRGTHPQTPPAYSAKKIGGGAPTGWRGAARR